MNEMRQPGGVSVLEAAFAELMADWPEPALGAPLDRPALDFLVRLLPPGPIPPVPDGLTDGALIEGILDAVRTVNIAHGRQMQLISELAHRRAGTAVTELTRRRAQGRQTVGITAQAVADELALELTLSKFDATRLLEQAVGLTLDAAPTLTALQQGDIDLRKADSLLDRVQTLLTAGTDDPDRADLRKMAKELQDRILPNAPSQPAAIMTRAASKEMINLDPEAAERRHKVKRERRHVRLTAKDDAMCELSAYLPADQAVRTMAALTALAEMAKTAGDERTLDQRRLDALVDAVANALLALEGVGIEHHCEHPDHHHREHIVPTDTVVPTDSTQSTTMDGDQPPSSGDDAGRPHDETLPTEPQAPANERSGAPSPDARRPSPARRADAEVIIVINAETLAGLNDDAAYLNGFGPILAGMARDVAATGTWRCAIANGEHGTLDGLGTKTYGPGYAPSQKLRRHLSVRDRTCRFPGCTALAKRCDVDHACRYPEGATCECNTECLCPHHHRIKHETGSGVRFSTDPGHPPGTLIWTTTGGREHLSYPEPVDPSHGNRAARRDAESAAEGKSSRRDGGLSYAALLGISKTTHSEGDSTVNSDGQPPAG